MTREQTLEAAKRCVCEDRNDTHGAPEDNFRTIAGLWSQYLHGVDRLSLSSADVAAMMILVKVSRLVTSPNLPDHWIDIAGYAACGSELTSKVAG
jgi:hypothetical protein